MNSCKICQKLDASLSSDTESGFGPEFNQLATISHEDYRGTSLRQCPDCDQIYEFRHWTPGGSDDAMVTTFHESLVKVSLAEATRWFSSRIEEAVNLGRQGYKSLGEIADVLRKDEKFFLEQVYRKIIDPKSGSGRCPKCGSSQVAAVGGAYEFTEMHCYACGHEDYCDEYQLGGWYT